MQQHLLNLNRNKKLINYLEIIKYQITLKCASCHKKMDTISNPHDNFF
jgi:hypothetical protein